MHIIQLSFYIYSNTEDQRYARDVAYEEKHFQQELRQKKRIQDGVRRYSTPLFSPSQNELELTH